MTTRPADRRAPVDCKKRRDTVSFDQSLTSKSRCSSATTSRMMPFAQARNVSPTHVGECLYPTDPPGAVLFSIHTRERITCS